MNSNSNLIKEIEEAHSDYIKRYGKSPNVAYVTVRWRNEQDEFNETIAVDGVDELPDEEILYYCNSVSGLINLTSEDSAEDFRVTGFICFDTIE